MGRPIGERTDGSRTPLQVVVDAVINPLAAFGPNSFLGQRRRMWQLKKAAASTSERPQAVEDIINKKKRI